MESNITNIALAPSGRAKIEYIKSYTPVLSMIEERFKREEPFKGMRITMSIHLEAGGMAVIELKIGKQN